MPAQPHRRTRRSEPPPVDDDTGGPSLLPRSVTGMGPDQPPQPVPARQGMRRAGRDTLARARREDRSNAGSGHAPTSRPTSQPSSSRTGGETTGRTAAETTGRTAAGEITGRPAATVPAIRRRDLRLVGRAAEIVKQDRRRRWVAGATILTVLGTIIIPSMIMGGSARADGVSQGTISLAPGKAATADSAIRVDDGTGRATFVLPGRPQGGSLYTAIELRTADRSSYRAKLRVYADGQINVGLSKVVDGAEKSLGNKRLKTEAGTGTTSITLEGAVSESSPARIAVRAWPAGADRPDWQLTASDTSHGIRAGSVRAWSYLSAEATAPLTLKFHGLTGTQDGAEVPRTPPTEVPEKPSATLTPTESPKGTSTTVTKPPTSSEPTKTDPSTGGGKATGGRPGSGNTGVPAGTDLKVRKGDLVITKAGARYDSLDIHGFVDVQAANVKITNSIIRGGKVGQGNRGVINATHSAVRNFVLEDSEVRPAHPNVLLDGVIGGNFTLRRVEVDGGVDTVKAFKDNVRVEGSWLHGSQKFAKDSNQGGSATHNDGVQILGGDNIRIVGNRIEGADNAAIMVSQTTGPTTDLVIKGNWLYNGGCSVNIVPKNLASIGPVHLVDNRFTHATRVANCAVARTASTKMVASGNVYEDSGAPAKINVWH